MIFRRKIQINKKAIAIYNILGIILIILLGCGNFRPSSGTGLTGNLDKARVRIHFTEHWSRDNYVSGFESGTIRSADENMPYINAVRTGVFTGIGLILVSGLFVWMVSNIRVKKLKTELDLKKRLISEIKEELEQALCTIRNLKSDLFCAQEMAMQSEKLKDSFVSNMSHEIRTPMNAIVGLTSFLNDPGLSKADAFDFIETINSSCRQLLTVIDDIVDISKIESGQIQITSGEVDLNNLLRDLYSVHRNMGKQNNINFTYSTGNPDDDAKFRTDGLRIRQVFCNLLNNAFKFTETGSIEFGYYPTDGAIKFYVRDEGIGISPELQSSIFSRFWQAESSISRSYGGLGLGLPISKRIVEKMGGTIWVESEPGKGSIFYFSLPVTRN